MARLGLYFIVLMLLGGCSSNMKKGDNMMEAEQYDEAVMYYEKALKGDPGDEEIAQKLYEARTRMVYAHLIKVRLQRQGQQPKAAAVLLNQSLKNIKRWKIIADSGVKATIEEEVMEAGFWLNKELSFLGSQDKYNQYFYHLVQFDEIFDTGLADQANKQYTESMKSKGKQQCNKMKRELTPQSHFLFDIWQAYCGVFGIQGKYSLKADSTRFKRLQVSSRGVKVTHNSGISAKIVSKNIERQLSNNLWIDSSGSKTLNLALNGNISYSKSQRAKTFTRIYKDKKETFELVKDPKNPKKEVRKLIHSKPLTKKVEFKGKEYTEKVAHKLELLVRMNGQSVSVSDRSSSRTHKTQSHSTYFKSEGIRPLSPKFFNKDSWLSGMSNELSQDMLSNMNEMWEQAYCESTAKNLVLANNEAPARCAKLNPLHPKVNAWTQQQFDLTYMQLQTLFKQ